VLIFSKLFPFFSPRVLSLLTFPSPVFGPLQGLCIIPFRGHFFLLSAVAFLCSLCGFFFVTFSPLVCLPPNFEAVSINSDRPFLTPNPSLGSVLYLFPKLMIVVFLLGSFFQDPIAPPSDPFNPVLILTTLHISPPPNSTSLYPQAPLSLLCYSTGGPLFFFSSLSFIPSSLSVDPPPFPIHWTFEELCCDTSRIPLDFPFSSLVGDFFF